MSQSAATERQTFTYKWIETDSLVSQVCEPHAIREPYHTTLPFYLHMSTYPSPSPKLILVSSLHIYLFLGTQPCSALSQLQRFLTLTVSVIILLPVCRCVLNLKHFNHVPLFATLWTIARQAPLSMRFSRQEHWSGLPCPPAGDLPDRGMELGSFASQVDSLPSEPPGKPISQWYCNKN